HIVLDKLVAIKTIHSNLYTPAAVQRFQIEGKAASSLSHPNIVAVYDFGVTQFGQPYMVMEYVNGRTLSDLLRLEGGLSSKKFLEVFSQVCSALAHAHRKSIVHRDLKPGNIMLVSQGHSEESVRIMDFGIAKILTEGDSTPSLTKTGETIGSPLYMSPEQARSLKTDYRSDLYSLGCVMYECLTGSPPFEGQTFMETLLMHMEKMPPSMKEASLGREIDPRLEKIVMRLLAKEPEQRYASMDDLLDALTNYKQIPMDTPPAGATKGDSKKTPSAKTKMLLGVFIVVVLVGSIAGYMFLNRRSKAPGVVHHTDIEAIGVNALSSPSKGTTIKDIRRRLINHPSELLLNNNLQMFPVEDSDLTPLDDADNTKDLEHVEISFTEVSDKGLEHLSKLTNLLRLDLRSNHKLRDLHALKPLTNLENVNVQDTVVDHDGLKVLTSLPNLERLNISRTNVTDADLKLLYKCDGLRELLVSNIGSVSKKALAELKAKLPNCTVDDVGTKSTTSSGIHSNYAHAFSYFSNKVFDKAANEMKEAEAIIANDPHYPPEECAKIYLLDGTIQMELRHFASASEKLSKALDFFARMNEKKDVHEIAETGIRVAQCYEVLSAKDPSKRKDSASARETADLSFRLLVQDKSNPSKQAEFRRQRVANLRDLVFDYAAVGECKLALKNEQLELELSREYDIPPDAATRNYKLLLGACLQTEKQYDAAIKRYQTALDITNKDQNLKKDMSAVVTLRLNIAQCNQLIDTDDSRCKAIESLKMLLDEPTGVLPTERIQALNSMIALLQLMHRESDIAPYKQQLQALTQQQQAK
ncbi:MAG TPA: protein kinase, partial [Oculatellaceae cyanobacterium]